MSFGEINETGLVSTDPLTDLTMVRAVLFQIALMITWGASAQDCQPVTLVALKQVYKASNRPNRILAEGFSLPMVKSDNLVVYHRCRKSIGRIAEVQDVSMPELINDGNRSRTIWFATYDRNTYQDIKAHAQATCRSLPSLKGQSEVYSVGYTDGRVAYLFGAMNVKDVTNAVRYRIALMPLTAL